MPLELTPESVRRLKFYLDGLGYSFEMAKICANRLRGTVDALGAAADAGNATNESAASALMDAWMLIDMCHRVRELIQQTPGLKVQSPEVKLFLQATGDTETLRHHVQHFRSGISALPADSYPLWGTLAWISNANPLRSYWLMSGNIIDGIQSHSLTFDTEEFRFVSRLVLSAEKTSIDLEMVADEIAKLRKFVKAWLQSDSRLKLDENGIPAIQAVEVKRPSPTGS